ncbi:SseB family protein [Epibacterium sp. SM1969]|uniref:SseB family protein n=1 Tax=Tritonibacter aquimaris TaxID=2663379 RepID=A0A844AV41_9RHOB|nr:SseB family protein [Tritonibacter aquimaris]MQY43328.1 SseB family protein [Tritonibacter aquimaris]
MSETTPLDIAHAAMMAAPNDDVARLRFYERLADSELFLLLASEPEGERVEPEVFQTEQGSFVLVFDREERLAGFAGRIVPYVALSGRIIVQMLEGAEIGLGLNLEVENGSQMLVPAEALDWLRDTLGNAPETVEANVEEVLPPKGLPEVLLTAIDTKLAMAAGLAESAYLVALRYDTGGQGHLLGFVGAKSGAENALAKAVSEALIFSGIEAGALDVGFFQSSDEMAGRLARVGLRYELPKPVEPKVERAAPGSDPDKPPRLR